MHDRPEARRARNRRNWRKYESAMRESQRRRSLEKQTWINEYLRTHPCVDCGEDDPVVLQFDHVKGKKRRDVTGLTLLSIKSILKEIAKCEVVCANDHTRRTAQRANTLRWKLNSVPTAAYTHAPQS